MTRCVAFLRAINVGGHTVTNVELARLFDELDVVDDPTPYQASGNVVLTAGDTSPDVLESRIEEHLAGRLGYEVVTFVRGIDEVAELAAVDAFPDAPAGAKVHVAFLKRPVEAAVQAALADLATDVDACTIRGRHVLWQVAGRFSDSPLAGPAFQRTLGQPTTLRTRSTLVRLAERFGA